ncbi:TetR/AcrR family transcriptional regulator [Actinocatenispora rupis]|uniref:HTH tetR-type domain-containing protein n=1 Tax=Actinocatenispora rupis TaxID=519421 RepID=A0A8J3NAU5_9ACTN|nr:TetR/AcrR family transcriptional regulator [Actinocatenispora rupis]GID09922.1 hypothetical protein Aru02nite_08110 [Actinocatenispora rupis]
MERRDEIVRAAYRCIGRNGLPGLRMRDVAAEAGVNIATVHYHLTDKTALIRAVVEHAHDTFREATAPPADTAPDRRLRVHLTRVFDVLRARPELGRVLAELALHAERDTAVAAIVAAAERRWLTALRAMLPPGPDATARCRLLLLTIKGACLPTAPRAARDARRALLRTVDLWYPG